MIPILQKEDPKLRAVSAPVPESEIGGPKIAAIVARMKEALESQDDGVAIAAPQIGENVRIFVVSGKTLALIAQEKKPSGHTDRFDTDTDEETLTPLPHLTFINPEIIKQSKKTEDMEEGCLSVRYFYGKVRRATKVMVRAYDEAGNVFTRGGSGLLAQIFQHEIDHLDGVLFIDKATDLEDIPPEHEHTHDN